MGLFGPHEYFEEEIELTISGLDSADIPKVIMGMEKLFEKQDIRIGRQEARLLAREEEMNERLRQLEGRPELPKTRQIQK